MIGFTELAPSSRRTSVSSNRRHLISLAVSPQLRSAPSPHVLARSSGSRSRTIGSPTVQTARVARRAGAIMLAKSSARQGSQRQRSRARTSFCSHQPRRARHTRGEARRYASGTSPRRTHSGSSLPGRFVKSPISVSTRSRAMHADLLALAIRRKAGSFADRHRGIPLRRRHLEAFSRARERTRIGVLHRHICGGRQNKSPRFALAPRSASLKVRT